MTENTDTNIFAGTADWSFDGIEESFDQHIIRSVPLYEDVSWLSVQLSDFFISDNSNYLDIGCSTGSLAQKISEHIPISRKEVCFELIDPVKSMLDYCENNISRHPGISYSFLNYSALDHDWEKCKYDFICIAFLKVM